MSVENVDKMHATRIEEIVVNFQIVLNQELMGSGETNMKKSWMVTEQKASC